MKRILYALSLLLCTHLHSKTPVPARLFQMTGSEVNVSEGDLLYKSQSAGYYTGGGGMVVRSPVKSTQFMSVHIPQIQAGCGGIDIYTGGFSFINSKQLAETLQTIASNSAGFAFMLGLESVSPMVTNQIRQFQSWANTINGIGINSCETAATLVGSVWPASEMASQHICRTTNTSNPLYQDYIEGRHNCSNETARQSRGNSTVNNLPLEGDYNIAWKALIAQPFFKNSNNRELAELYMTLVGTFIVKDKEIKTYFSKAEDNEFLTNLLEGGKIKKYTCKDSDCLEILENEYNVSVSDSWFSKIRKTLTSMHEKGIRDEPLDSNEKGLLLTTRLPLVNFVNILNAHYRGGPCSMELDTLAEIISWDVLAQIINEALDTVRRGCAQLRATSMYSTEIDLYLKDLDRVQKVVRRYEDYAKKGVDLEMRLIQKMELLKQKTNSEIMVN